MKKIYTIVGVCLLAATVSFGQGNGILTPTQAKLTSDQMFDSETVKATANNKAAGDQIWIEEFNNPGLPTGWYSMDNTAMGRVWEQTDGVHNAQYTTNVGLNSNSGGNHIMLFGDSLNQGGPFSDLDSYVQTSGITLNGEPNVSIRFFQRFRLCCQQTAALNVVVSTDSTFSSNVNTFSARGATAINAFNSVELKVLNITSAVGGYTGKIWIRFHWAGGASHYIWLLDDIEVFETEYNDLVAGNTYYGIAGLQYTRIPHKQIQPMDFFMRVDNIGSADQLNTIMTASVNSGAAYNGTSAGQTVIAGAANDSLGIAAGWTPPMTVAVAYDIVLSASSDSTESTPLDNGVAFNPFEVSYELYAHDDFGGTGPFWGNGGGYNTQVTPPTEEFEAGNWYDIFVADTALSIDVVIGSNSQAGAIIDAAIYDISSGSFVEVPGSRTAPYSITAGDISSNATITLPFVAPVGLIPGTYFICVHAWAGAGAEFFYGTSGRSTDGQGFGAQQSLIFYPTMAAPNTGENFFTTQTPAIRLRTGFLWSVNDKYIGEFDFSVYPNPSATGEFTINLNAATSENVNLTVTNVVGQTVVNRVIAVSGQTKEVISLAGQSKGVYFLNVNNETVKLIVE